MPWLLKSGARSYWHPARGWISNPNEAEQLTDAEKESRAAIPRLAKWVKLTRHNHMFTLAFECMSFNENGDDVTPDMLRAALLKRIINLDEDQAWIEAVGAPDDSFEEDDT